MLSMRAHGVIRDDLGAPVANALVQLCANDTSGGEYAQPTCVHTRTAADGTFAVEGGGWSPGGFSGSVSVIDDRDGGTLTLAIMQVPAPLYGQRDPEVEVALFVPGPSTGAPIDGVHVIDDRDGVRVCVPRDLHRCSLHRRVPNETLFWTATDLTATASCEHLPEEIATACRAASDADRARCLASHGIFRMDRGLPEGEGNEISSLTFDLQCAEGHASGGFDLEGVRAIDEPDAVRICLQHAQRGCRLTREGIEGRARWAPCAVAATASCETQRADVTQACGADPICSAAHGVFLLTAIEDREPSGYTISSWELECDEGRASGPFDSPATTSVSLDPSAPPPPSEEGATAE
jgi:hypothetical protein